MGSIVSSITGGAGGAGGTGYSIGSAPITTPVTSAQTDQAYLDQQDALKNQQGFVNALNAQNGVANQSSVFNQMQGVANGTGPNPAQAQLAQATGANVANQAALMAGQRGSGANAGLMARQAAMQGANTQQAAAGQAATLQANQSLNALNQMGTMAQNQVSNQANANAGLNSAALQGQQNLLNSVAGVNNAQVANQGSINSANAALAGGRQGQQGNMMGSLMNGVGMAGQLFGGGAGGGGGGGAALGDAANTGEMLGDGNALSGIGDVAAIAAQGGKVTQHGMQRPPQMMAQGGLSELDPTMAQPAPITPVAAAPVEGPQSAAGKYLSQGSVNVDAPQMTPINIQQGGGGSSDPISGLMGGVGGMMGGMPGMSGGLPGMGGGGGSSGGGVTQTHASASGAQVPDAGAPNKDTGGGGFNWGGAGKGALSGAGTGAAVGSAFGGVGAVPGAIIGGIGGALLGGFSYAEGGQVPALVSPGEQYLPPKDAKEVAKGKKKPFEAGERIPGKPKMPGNSYANDTVPKTLQSGGVVIPNAIMQSKDAEQKAAAFVRQVLARKGGLPSKGKKKD